MSTIQMSAAYEFYVVKRADSWRLSTMVSCTASLATGPSVGELTATFADPGYRILRQVDPQPMHLVQLILTNRFGQRAIAWTGYVDAVARATDPQGGQVFTLSCTSPYKLWEITRQTAQQTLALAVSYAQNVTASSVLRYSMRAIGYPDRLLALDPLADAASGFQASALQTAPLTPDEQTWSATIQALLANSGAEFFFKEDGSAVWRRLGYLTVPAAGYRPVLEEEILQHSLATSDAGVVTQVEVRFPGTGYAYYQAGRWPRTTAQGGSAAEDAIHTAMVKHLGERTYPLYAPWIFSAKDAQNLAQTLGMQLASHTLSGFVTLLADPCFTIGSVCEVPTLLAPGETAYYYVSTVAYSLSWGGAWTQTLGLSYGRAKDQSFPYSGKEAYPRSSSLTQGPAGAGNILTGATGTGRLATPFVVVRDDTLDRNTVRVDPTIMGAGTVIQVRDAVTNARLGHSTNGDFTTIAGPPGLTVYMRGTSSTAAAVLIIILAPSTTAVDPTATTPTDTSSSSGTSTVAPDVSATNPTPAPIGTNGGGAGLTTPTSFVRPVAEVGIGQRFGAGTAAQGIKDHYTFMSGTYSGYCWDGIDPSLNFHEGFDFLAPLKTQVVSATTGEVVFAANDGGIGQQAFFSVIGIPDLGLWTGYGWCVVVQTANLYFVYGHLFTIQARAGTTVHAGQAIGLSGTSGNSTGPHLHYGVWNDDLQRGQWGGVDHGKNFSGLKGDWDYPGNYLPNGGL